MPIWVILGHAIEIQETKNRVKTVIFVLIFKTFNNQKHKTINKYNLLVFINIERLILASGSLGDSSAQKLLQQCILKKLTLVDYLRSTNGGWRNNKRGWRNNKEGWRNNLGGWRKAEEGQLEEGDGVRKGQIENQARLDENQGG